MTNLTINSRLSSGSCQENSTQCSNGLTPLQKAAKEIYSNTRELTATCLASDNTCELPQPSSQKFVKNNAYSHFLLRGEPVHPENFNQLMTVELKGPLQPEPLLAINADEIAAGVKVYITMKLLYSPNTSENAEYTVVRAIPTNLRGLMGLTATYSQNIVAHKENYNRAKELFAAQNSADIKLMVPKTPHLNGRKVAQTLTTPTA